MGSVELTALFNVAAHFLPPTTTPLGALFSETQHAGEVSLALMANATGRVAG